MSVSLFNAVSPSGSAQGAPAGAIEVLTDRGLPQFKRADLGRFLGLANVKSNYSNVATKSRSELIRPGVRSPDPRSGMYGGGKNPHDAFVDLEGALEIVVRSKKPKALQLLKEMGVSIYDHKYVSKETETLTYILKAFKGKDMRDQYWVDGYRIDLYFPTHKLAIECDEFGHDDRDIGYEIARQKHIEQKLDCTFIRYNPDAKHFDIFQVINKIFRHIAP